MYSYREPKRGLLRRPRAKLITGVAAGLLLLGGVVTFAQVSSAGERSRGFDPMSIPALAAAARIPNDQGPPKECQTAPPATQAPTAAATTAPAATTPAATTPATSAPGNSAPPADPSQPPAADPAVPSAGDSAPPAADPAADQATGPVVDPNVDPATQNPPAVGVASAADEKAIADSLHHSGGANTSPACHTDLGGPVTTDYVDIRSVAPNARADRPARGASTGTFDSICGRNQNNHFNSDNFIVAPGVSNGAHHVHEYVGNLSANGQSTNQSLSDSGTTCRRDDRSTYYFPVLRQRGTVGADAAADGGGKDGNVGKVIRPSAVRLEWRGNTASKVVAVPQFIRIITGDAKATTNGPANAKAQWTCTGFTNRLTTKYPLCPRGSQVQRILNFPSCWDGVNTDSANHRTHIVFPDATGACPTGTKAVPQLRMTLTYSVPGGRSYSLDTFPEQLHNPLTDHADFVNVMPDALMSTVADCINRGRRC